MSALKLRKRRVAIGDVYDGHGHWYFSTPGGDVASLHMQDLMFSVRETIVPDLLREYNAHHCGVYEFHYYIFGVEGMPYDHITSMRYVGPLSKADMRKQVARH